MARKLWLLLSPRVQREGLPLLARSAGLGIAHLRRVDLGDGIELIATRLQLVPAERHGRDFGLLDDLLVVLLSDAFATGAAEELLVRFTPSPRQLVAALVLGRGPAAGRWTGAVQEDGEIQAMAGFTVVGPGMLRVSADPTPPSPEDVRRRWSRTRGALGEGVWQRVHHSRVAVVGAGRNGSAAALTLALLGVRRLVLVDGDRDEVHNLDATLGCDPSGIGRPKVANRLDILRKIRPDLDVLAVPHSLPQPDALAALRGNDLLLTCVDHDTARLTVARLANRWVRPHLDIGSGIFRDGSRLLLGGDVRLSLPGESCVACTGGLRNLAEAEYETAGPPGILRRGTLPLWSEQRAGSLLTLNQMVVHTGLQLWLDLLSGRLGESVWLNLEWRPGEGLVTSRIRPTPGPCPLCRPSAGVNTPHLT